MTCKNCSIELKDGVNFCAACGTKISDASVEFHSTQIKDPTLKGLAGWLIVLFLGLAQAVIALGIAVKESYKLFSDGSVEILNDSTSALYTPGISTALKIEFAVQIIFLILGLYLIVLYFQKNKKFQKFYIAFYAGMILFGAIDYAMIASLDIPFLLQETFNNVLSKQVGHMVQAVIGGAIWISYIIKSKRVRATFIEE